MSDFDNDREVECSSVLWVLERSEYPTNRHGKKWLTLMYHGYNLIEGKEKTGILMNVLIWCRSSFKKIFLTSCSS